MTEVSPYTDHAFKMLDRALASENRDKGMRTGMPYVRVRDSDAYRIQAVSRRNYDRITALEDHANTLASYLEQLRATINASTGEQSPAEMLEAIQKQMQRVPVQHVKSDKQ